MDPQTITHRRPDEVTTTDREENDKSKKRSDKRIALARKGIRSLAIAISFPLCLSVFSIYFFKPTVQVTKPMGYLPSWALHVASLSSTTLMGISAWFVWAEGGFHREPISGILYLIQLFLSLLWGPIFLGMGKNLAGLIICASQCLVLCGCYWYFRRVNPIAGSLVQPCLAWAVFLTSVSYKLL